MKKKPAVRHRLSTVQRIFFSYVFICLVPVVILAGVLAVSTFRAQQREDAARQAITPASALIQLLHGINELGDVCSRIDGIQPGYAARSTLTGVTQLTPVWQVNTDTVVYQLDLVSGAVTRLSE